jgi:c-di-GMP-binding flagellar brake protein YcgR
MKGLMTWLKGIVGSDAGEQGASYRYAVNQAVRMRFTYEGNVYEARSRVADITAGAVVLYNPVIAGRMYVLPIGTAVHVTAFADRGVYMFTAAVIAGGDTATMVTLQNRGLEKIERQEARRTQRVWASMEVLCYARRENERDKTQAMEVWSRDISEGGLCLRSNAPFAEGDLVDVSFYLPQNRGHISAGARVVRASDDIVPGTYLIGISFTRLTDAARRQVRVYVTEQARKES